MDFLKSKNKDVMLVNMMYSYGNKSNGYTDTLDVVYRDLKTNEKKLKSIENPELDIYFVKDKYRDYNHNKNFMEMDKLDVHRCKAKNVLWDIAKVAGPSYMADMKSMVETGNRQDMRKMHMYPYVFGSDVTVENFYRVQWMNEYDNDKPKKLTKAYFDIEVDTIDITGFPRDGQCPINAITLINDENKTVYTLLLNNPNNPQIKEFVDDIDGFINELHESFDDIYGYLEYNIYMYDDERDLIKSLYNIVNTLKPDFLMAWNGFGFDEPYIIARCQELGLNPAEVMCHPDFSTTVCKFTRDTINFKIANKSDKLELSSYTKHIDQMRLYAATRKGQLELRNTNLNYIGRKELKDEKIDYSEIANIKTLPYENYRLFCKYNIKDVLLQYGIENKVHDLDNLYLRSYSNCTPYDAIFKQTVMLKCRAYYEYLLQGIVIGNNINVYLDEDGSFTGALVGNPLLNSHTGIMIFDEHSMYIYDNVIDMDFSAMYPHTIIAHNIERNTMIGKLVIPDFITERYPHLFIEGENYENNEEIDDDDDEDSKEAEFLKVYDAGRDFVDNYNTGDIISIGSKWFNLPDYEEISNGFKKKMGIRDKIRISIPKSIIKTLEHIKINI